jgi:hypothetical protein
MRTANRPVVAAALVGIVVLAVAFVQWSPLSGNRAAVSASPSRTAVGFAAGSPNDPTGSAGFDSTASADPTVSATAAATATPNATATATPTPTPTVGPTATARATPRPTATPTVLRSLLASIQPSAPPSATASPKPIATSSAPCPMFPASNVWNRDISALPVAANSSAMVDAIGLTRYLHPDFDAVGDGIPYNIVNSSTPTYQVQFDYADESDPGPYPIPARPAIEGGSDAHMLMLDPAACRLWELFAVSKSGTTWSAGSGATWDLRSNALRPAGWTSADAAGLPILPGLVRYDEVVTGVIRHAIRFTANSTCGYIYPARHLTAAPCSNLPPMGLRVRLKASVDISGFGPQAQVVLTALKRYGMILADNGSPWYISGAPDSRWNDDELHHLQQITGADFEVVDTSGLVNG